MKNKKHKRKGRHEKPINLSHLTPKEIIKAMLETPPLHKKPSKSKAKKK